MQAIRARLGDDTNFKAYLALVAGVLSVSLAAIFIRLAQDAGMPSLVIAGGRLLLAAIILTPITLRNSSYRQQIAGLTRRDRALLAVSGLFLAIHFASWVTSLEYTTVLISVVIVTTTPIWVALLEVFFLNARLARPIIVGLTISISGSILINAGQGGDAFTGADTIRGAILAFVGALAVAVYLVIGRSLRPHLALMPYIWLVYGFAAILLSLVVILTATPVTGHSGEAYFWVIAVALIPQLIGHSALNYVLGYLPATYVSIATQAEPIASAAIAIAVFNEVPDIWQIAGSAIILIGVTIATLGQSTTTQPGSQEAVHVIDSNS